MDRYSPTDRCDDVTGKRYEWSFEGSQKLRPVYRITPSLADWNDPSSDLTLDTKVLSFLNN